MCGIVGCVAKSHNGFFSPELQAFYTLLFVDSLRGEDSTGVIAVEKDSTFHIAKEASIPSWFIPQFETSTAGKAMLPRGKALIGHNRKKTVGAVADDTAHPFVVDDTFAMVHNGTLFSHKHLADTMVDSEALAIHFKKSFDDEAPIASLEEELDHVYGAYATAMYDQKKHEVRLLRNKERPMSIIETDKAWFFASEAPMLYWVLGRQNLLLKDTKVTEVPVHTLVTFDLDKNKMEMTELTVKKATPPTVTGTKGGKITRPTLTSKVEGGLSKSQYKRFRKQRLNTIIQWWPDDYVETNYPSTEDKGEVEFNLMGTCEDVDEDHIVFCRVNKTHFQIGKAIDLIDRKWMGKIENMSYDAKSRRVTISLGGASPLPISIPSKKKKVHLVDKDTGIIYGFKHEEDTPALH